jgi:hypothetical protein
MLACEPLKETPAEPANPVERHHISYRLQPDAVTDDQGEQTSGQ